CKWPPSPIIVTSETIKTAVEPSPEWPIYSIRLADNGKEYSNFNKAWHQKIKINSEASSSEADTSKKNSYKRLKIISKHLSSDSDSCDESYQIYNTADNSGLKTISTLEKYSVGQNNCINPLFSSNENPENVQVEDDGQKMTYVNENANNQFVNSIKATAICSDTTNVDNLESSPYHNIPSTSIYNMYDICNSEPENSVDQYVPFLSTNVANKQRTVMKILLSIENQNNLIMKEQSIMKLVQDRLLNKVNGLELNVKGNITNSHGSSVHLDSDFLSKFPLNNNAMYVDVENLTLNDSSFKIKLEYFIRSVGGSNSKNHVQKMMGKFFNDEYATKCTRTGRGKDKTTTFGKSELLNVLKKVVKECNSGNSVEFTDSNFENIKISRKKKDLGLVTTGHFRKIINLEKKKHDTFFNKLQPNYNNCDPSPIINVNTNLKLKNSNSNSLSVLSNYNLVEYPSKDTFTVKNNPSLNVLTISSDNLITQNLQPYNIDLKDKIRSWILHHKVSHSCANSILKIMKSEGLQVPSDVRTLMKTPLSHKIVNMDNGSYIHFGLEKMLTPILKKYFNKIDLNNVLKLGINIDGLPITKSSKNQLWPILLSIINWVFQGLTKPLSVTEYFHSFLLDISVLLDSGLCVNDKIFKFEIGHIVCDSPVKAFLLNVKGHNGYFGCSSCTQESRYVQNRMTFPDINAPLRSDESFRNRTNEDYHKGDSPLELLPIDIVSTVCLDYMHNICLGITKRLVEFWVKGKKDVRLTEENRKQITVDLLKLRPYIPSEFSRLPRAIEDIDYWKATELR
ncbi:Uncharacterized protein FWK35_00024025, partial [Aphis craccivora]